MSKSFDVIIAGGGAAGFFTAINIAEANPDIKIAILERGKEVLSKVRISGGGRCNVTHACFIPNDLVKFYPRGEKELRGPFNRFCSGDTIEWFERHGVELKIEEDGRMFPVTDSSQTIIDCFQEAVKKLRIQVVTGQSIQTVYKAKEHWKIETQNENYVCETLVMATGSNPKMWQMMEELGHTIVPPVPSLFTFNIKDSRIKDLMGVSAHTSVKVKGSKLEASDPLLITHWGMSGPGILRLSAWGARELAEKNYQFTLQVNWLNDVTVDECIDTLKDLKQEQAKKLVAKKSPFDFPNRLWENLVAASGINDTIRWADLSGKQLNELANQLVCGEFQVNGKSTFKEEFVTAGGIELKEVNFKTMESKIVEDLYFAGEILNIDAITGGFNFQNAWTGGFIVAESVISKK
ncbi:NAD(P)/FAD-dependent oxidoreductase [Flavobacterium salilacus subsp. salilacus]|uniref:NAD(P)/FAD-dependent oxidoreductase n=1 Tax=Flavobacterium TaxID=237 RepID=UPI001075292F|nr:MULTISPECIES: NAD(P)/FAD-dependent oxidoreductase [Flavobacterium]KAF2514818.1 NAD(P)/FAD-dependent oxidoreductase [Flavobacterium salilacus subsp. salilacus]MBE1615460.1 NAD(P)/FAD-dependent oxidoreductase [Flavobacterium sp. SaA2.13]